MFNPTAAWIPTRFFKRLRSGAASWFAANSSGLEQPLECRSDCGSPGLPDLSQPVDLATWPWGDVDGTGVVDVDDLLCMLDGFAGKFPICTMVALDLMDCQPSGQIDVDDILAVLDGFSGVPYPCPPLCP